LGEVFKEQLVKRASNSKDTAKRIGIIVLAVLILFICTIIPVIQSFLMFIVVGVAFGAFFLMSLLNVEYEYAFTNGELDIDIIYNRSRRKRAFSGIVKDFEVMAHVDDKAYAGDFHNVTEIKDFSSGVVNVNTYAFLSTYKGKRLKIIIEPNDMMLKAFSTVLTPRKLHKKL
jgi:hypothetical protein